MKRCGRCKKRKDESEFYENSCQEDGLSCWCKKCRREYRRKYYGWTKRHLRYEQRHRVVGRVKQKRCGKCKKWKPESEFYKKSANKDGLRVWCKQCFGKATTKDRERRRAARN